MTGDDEFWRNIGVPILLETAIFWGDRAETDIRWLQFSGCNWT